MHEEEVVSSDTSTEEGHRLRSNGKEMGLLGNPPTPLLAGLKLMKLIKEGLATLDPPREWRR